MEKKLDKTKVIGFYRVGGGEWFKVQVRRGWSDKCLTSNESAIDDALWLASCRCMGDLCEEKNACPHADKLPQFRGRSDGKDNTLDLDGERTQLTKNDQLQLEQRPPDWSPCDNDRTLDGVECSFKKNQISLWSLCDIR